MPGDGLHLTNESTEIMAEYITKAINDQLNQPIASEDIEVKIEASDSRMLALDEDLETKEPQNNSSKTIRINRSNYQEDKTLYNVEMHTKQAGEDQRLFVIKGNPSDTT